MIEMYQLEQLLAIYNAGTISKAAEEMHISQPGLTRSIQRLEDSLGLQLFDRKKNKVVFNNNGIMAVKYAKKILHTKDEMVLQLQRYDRSQRIISIGSCAPAPIWGLNYIFNKIYPEMQILSEINSDENILWKGLDDLKYSIIVLNHPIDDEKYICMDLFEEYLYLSVPPAHPLALFKEISFKELDGESILLLSKIGFWNEICLKMIPNSHLLVQEDNAVFNELTKLSALPNFRSNITIQRENNDGNRVFIPITDKSAHIHYYAAFKKADKKIFAPIKDEITIIDWKQTYQQ